VIHGVVLAVLLAYRFLSGSGLSKFLNTVSPKRLSDAGKGVSAMLRSIFVILAGMVFFACLESGANAAVLKIGDTAPKIEGSEWINSRPLGMDDLSGRVVLVEFWTYG